jgi:hypothetical protein
MLKVVDEIISALFDKREIGFNLTTNELQLIEQFYRDEFYIRRYGD